MGRRENLEVGQVEDIDRASCDFLEKNSALNHVLSLSSLTCLIIDSTKTSFPGQLRKGQPEGSYPFPFQSDIATRLFFPAM
jgi:hypothetical protein